MTNVNINLQVLNICDLKAFQSIQSNDIKQQEEGCTLQKDSAMHVGFSAGYTGQHSMSQCLFSTGGLDKLSTADERDTK